MVEPVRVYIERVKAALGVTTDEEAAKSLGISKQAIANWRRRGKIPWEVEIRLINAFGPDFAHNEITREVATNRENDVTYAATLYAFSKFEKDLKRNPTLDERISMGHLFREAESIVREKIREIGFEEETSESVLEILIELIDLKTITKLNNILGKINQNF
ncbi:helix-turn-helix domain-containing protein [Agrobacterium vitis]|nr:helix-turn-helix domain-containing protein [Agrobacterium vitis]